MQRMQKLKLIRSYKTKIQSMCKYQVGGRDCLKPPVAGFLFCWMHKKIFDRDEVDFRRVLYKYYPNPSIIDEAHFRVWYDMPYPKRHYVSLDEKIEKDKKTPAPISLFEYNQMVYELGYLRRLNHALKQVPIRGPPNTIISLVD